MSRAFAIALFLSGGIHAAPDARLDLGAISGAPALSRGESSVHVTRIVEIPLDGMRGGRGTLFAHLEGGADPRFRVRLGGVQLSSVPRVVDAHARLGRTARYVLDLEVPREAAEGPLRSDIRWNLELDR